MAWEQPNVVANCPRKARCKSPRVGRDKTCAFGWRAFCNTRRARTKHRPSLAKSASHKKKGTNEVVGVCSLAQTGYRLLRAANCRAKMTGKRSQSVWYSQTEDCHRREKKAGGIGFWRPRGRSAKSHRGRQRPLTKRADPDQYQTIPHQDDEQKAKKVVWCCAGGPHCTASLCFLLPDPRQASGMAREMSVGKRGRCPSQLGSVVGESSVEGVLLRFWELLIAVQSGAATSVFAGHPCLCGMMLAR